MCVPVRQACAPALTYEKRRPAPRWWRDGGDAGGDGLGGVVRVERSLCAARNGPSGAVAIVCETLPIGPEKLEQRHVE